MGKITLFYVICFVTGIPALIFCYNWITDRSFVIGQSEQVQGVEIVDESFGYSLTYNLDGGTADNPDYYTLFSETFRLNNPIKDGFEFLGWTGSNGETPQLKIIICQGSSGNLEFTANFMPILNAPEVELIENVLTWHAVDNATSYTININGYTGFETESTTFDLTSAKEYIIEGNNIIKVKANSNVGTSSAYSENITFFTQKLLTPIISLKDNIVSWNEIANAKEYIVSIGGQVTTTTETSINLLNYTGFLSNNGYTNIRVKASAFENTIDYINSSYSDSLQYVSILSPVELSISGNKISWSTDDRAGYYEIYLNGNLAQRVTDFSSYDLLNFETILNTNNNVYVKACRNGFVGATSNTINYTYHNVAQFENLQIEMDFNRTSSLYALNVNDDHIYTNSEIFEFTNNTITLSTDNIINFDFYCYDKENSKFINGADYFDGNSIYRAMAFWLEWDFYSYRLTFNQELDETALIQSMKDFILFINSNYVNGIKAVTLDISEMFKVVYLDGSGEYVPNKMTLKINFGEMFTSATFAENIDTTLDAFSTNNIGNAQFNYNWTNFEQTNSTLVIKLEDMTGEVKETLLNNADTLFDASTKFKLGDNHYFIIKNISQLLNDMYAYAQEKVKEYVIDSSWQGSCYETFDITPYIEVYNANDTLVTYAYKLGYKFLLATGGTY